MLFTKRALVLVFLTVIFLTTFSPVLADDSLTPQVKNPMNEIGFYKDHVYDFKDIVAVDQLSGSANITIPIGSMKGKGVGAFTLPLLYTESASVHVLNVNYATSDNDDEVWEPGLLLQPDSTNVPVSWHTIVPTLRQWKKPTPGKPDVFNIQYRTMEFTDETGVTQSLIETGDDVLAKSAYYKSRDSSTKSATFDFTIPDPKDGLPHPTYFPEGGYSDNIFKTGGICYTGIAEMDVFGVGLANFPDKYFNITKTDTEGNWLNIQSTDTNSDGHYDTIQYKNNTDNLRIIQLTSGADGTVSSVTSPGMGTVTFHYITVTINDTTKKFLKSITLEDHSTYQFDYYFIHDAGSGQYEYNPAIPSNDSTVGNAYFKLPESNTKVYFIMLKSITLPTGGSIELRYQIIGGTTNVTDGGNQDINHTSWHYKDYDYYARLGVKELIYRDKQETVVEKRKYSIFQPHSNGTPGKSLNENYFLNQFSARDTSTPPLIKPLSNGAGRRILVTDGSDPANILSLTDQVYKSNLAYSAPYLDSQARIKQIYNYADPETAWNTITSTGYDGSQISNLVRTVTDNEYRVKLSTEPFSASPDKGYFGNFYLVKSETKKYEKMGDPPTVQLVKTTTSTTQYYGLDNNGTAENNYINYDNEDSKGLVVPERSETTASDGSGTTLLDTVKENQYAYLNSDSVSGVPLLWMAQSLASMKTEGSEKWLSKNTYDLTHPWRVTSSTSGPGTDAGGGVWNFNTPTYTVTNTFFADNDTARKGLVESRTLSLVGGTGTPSNITEHFDYTAGILTSYTLGDGTPSLTTTRTIDTTTGLVKSQTNPDGTSVTYDWDRSNRLIGIHPIGADTTHTPLTATSISYNIYNAGTNTPAFITVSGKTTNKYYYDGLGRLTYEGSMAWNGQFDWSRVEYNGLEQIQKNWTGLRLASETNPWQTETWQTVARIEHDFDGYGREVKTRTYASGSTLETTKTANYTAFSKALSLYHGEVVEGTAEDQRELVYDAKGNLVKLKIYRDDEEIDTPKWVTKTTYEYSDLFNKLLAVHLNKEDSSAGQDRTFEYDSLGNLTSTVTPEEGTITYSGYNLFGKPSTKTQGTVDPNSDHRIVSFTYDALGRETERNTVETKPGDPDYPITETIKTSWGDAGISNGKIAQLQSKLADKLLTQIDYEYDLITGNLKTKKVSLDTDTSVPGFEIANKEIGLTYDLNGNLKTLAYPMESISGFTNAVRTLTLEYYSTNNQPRELSYRFTDSTRGYTYPDQPKALVGSMTYEPTGGTTYNTGDTLSNVITNDTLGRLTGITYGDNLLSFSNYTYDARGNITQLHMTRPGTDVTNTYTYDDYNQLRSAGYNYGSGATIDETFKYDYAGNMTTQKRHPENIQIADGGFEGKTYNSKNQDPSMTYDDYGNVTQLAVEGKANSLDLAYTPFSHVRSVTEGTNKYEYTYDGEGKRVVKKIYKNNTELTEIHIYIRGATGKILEELKKVKKADGTWSDWTWVKDYYYFGDKLISAASAE